MKRAPDDEEIVLGVRCVGAPVVDTKGQVRGAIGVAGPVWRMTRQRLELLGPEVMEAARRIGAQLVARSPLDSAGAPKEDLVQAVAGPWAFHGACPVWCAQTRQLYWADSLAPAVRVWNSAAPNGQGDRQLALIDSPIKGLALLPQRLLVAHAQGWAWLNGAGELTVCKDWPVQPVCALTVAPDADHTVWAAVTDTEQGGCMVGVLSVEGRTAGRFEARWRTPEILSSLAW